jgi:hypothetical protein
MNNSSSNAAPRAHPTNSATVRETPARGSATRANHTPLAHGRFRRLPASAASLTAAALTTAALATFAALATAPVPVQAVTISYSSGTYGWVYSTNPTGNTINISGTTTVTAGLAGAYAANVATGNHVNADTATVMLKFYRWK